MEDCAQKVNNAAVKADSSKPAASRDNSATRRSSIEAADEREQSPAPASPLHPNSDSEYSSGGEDHHLADLKLLKSKFTLNDTSRMSYNSGIVDPHMRTGLPFVTIGSIFGTTAARMPELLKHRADQLNIVKRGGKEHKERNKK